MRFKCFNRKVWNVLSKILNNLKADFFVFTYHIGVVVKTGAIFMQTGFDTLFY